MSNAEKPKFVSSLMMSMEKEKEAPSSGAAPRKAPARRHSNEDSNGPQHSSARHHDDARQKKPKRQMMYVVKKDSTPQEPPAATPTPAPAPASAPAPAPAKFKSSLLSSVQHDHDAPQPPAAAPTPAPAPFKSSLQAALGKQESPEKPPPQRSSGQNSGAQADHVGHEVPIVVEAPKKTLKQSIEERGLNDRRTRSHELDDKRQPRRNDESSYRQVHDVSKGRLSRQSSRESSHDGDKSFRRSGESTKRDSIHSRLGPPVNDDADAHPVKGSRDLEPRRSSILSRLGPPTEDLRKVTLDDKPRNVQRSNTFTPAEDVRRVTLDDKPRTLHRSNTFNRDNDDDDRRRSRDSRVESRPRDRDVPRSTSSSFEKPPVHGSSLMSSLSRSTQFVEKPPVPGSSLRRSISLMKSNLESSLVQSMARCNSPAHGKKNETKIRYTFEELRSLNSPHYPRPADLRDMTVIVEPLSPRSLAAKTRKFGSAKPLRRQQPPVKSIRVEKGRRSSKYKQQQKAPAPLPLDGPVKPYVKSESRWVPSKEKEKPRDLQNQIKTLLNKLTRDRFEKLTADFCAIPLRTLGELSLMIAMIMDKALEEPNFAEVYADLCARLHQHYLQKRHVFLHSAVHIEEQTWYWTAANRTTFQEFRGPFPSQSACFESLGSQDPAKPTIPAESIVNPAFFVSRGHLVVVGTKALQPNGYYMSAIQIESLGENEPLLGTYASEELALKAAVKLTSFKRLLVTRCQDRFDSSEHKVKPTDSDEAIKAAKRTKTLMLGNMRFLGELFKVELVAEAVIQSCIFKLLGLELVEVSGAQAAQAIRMPDEEDLEALCKMMATVGKKFDHKGTQTIMTMIVVRIVELSETQALPSRIRFLLKDILEMRDYQWVPRRKELQQKTLQEVRKEAEKLQKLGKNAQHDDLQGKRKKAAHSSVELAKQNSTLLLHQSSSAPVDYTNRIKSILKEFLSLHDIQETRQCVAELPREAHVTFVEQTLTLAFEGKEKERSDAVEMLVGLYETLHLGATEIQSALLGMLEFLDDSRIDIPMIHEYCGHVIGRLVAAGCFDLGWFQSGVGHLADSGLAGQLLVEVLSVLEAELGVDSVASMLVREELSVQAFLPSDQQTPEAVAAFVKTNDLESFFDDHEDDEAYEECVQVLMPIIQEYFMIEDLTEVEACLDELTVPYASSFVKLTLNLLCECKDTQRSQLTRLFRHIAGSKRLSAQEFEMGLASWLTMLEDIQIDVPQAATYIAPVVATGISTGLISWSWLASVVDEPSRSIAQLVHHVCSELEAQTSHDDVVAAIKSSNVAITSFAPLGDVDQLKQWFV